jgi:hypothetical protein
MSATRDLPTIWQIGTGDGARPYEQWMIDHDIALIGSSWAGRWPNEDYGPEPAIRRFAEDVRAGDLVVAKRGRREALAVGVLGEYDFSEDLDDVEGWDMGHFRRVRWLVVRRHRFVAPLLARDRFARTHAPEVRRWVAGAIGAAPIRPPAARELRPLPHPGPRLDVATLAPDLRDVVAHAAALHRHTYGGGYGCHPSEHELTCHVTVPLLCALGWPREQIAIEWRRADVALFAGLDRDPTACRVVIEAKKPGDGLGYAHSQAARYARRLPGPVDLVVTDGLRYRVFVDAQPDAPPLYANLTSLREPARRLFNALRPR